MNMNERLMQFRIGMFVIVAGLVLTMMIIWFGESPSILRDQVYLTVHYTEAPGVLEGVPVRKSGIRIGEVSSIKFDDRPNQPDGVLVTLALERKYKILKGTRPRLSRTLIGDVTVDMQPGTGPDIQETSPSRLTAPVIDGEVAADPSKALEAATKVFEKAGDTLQSINEAASGLAKIAKSAEKLDDFLASVADAGKNVSKAAQGIDRVIKSNEADIQPAIASLRKVADKLDDTLEAKTREAFKMGVDRFSAASARLEAGLAQIDPVLKDLGAPVNKAPVTDLGQAIRRINLVSSDLELLTRQLRDGRGGLNTGGSIQKLITQSELHDNLNTMAVSATQAIAQLRVVLNSLRVFAEKVSNDPSSLARGALRPN
jgi:phospholipid/cholesterol/gamma-HCH transport system substrate-binding protein